MVIHHELDGRRVPDFPVEGQTGSGVGAAGSSDLYRNLRKFLSIVHPVAPISHLQRTMTLLI